MAFLGRLLGLMALSVSVWFVPMAMLVCGGTISWLIPISQGAPRLFVLLIILLLPPLCFLLLAWVALRKTPSPVSSHPTVFSRQVSSFGNISNEKQDQRVDYARPTRPVGIGFR